MEADRLSAAARPTVGVPATGVSLSVAPDCELSRRNKPITDLACLGLVRPPDFVFLFLYVISILGRLIGWLVGSFSCLIVGHAN